MPLPVVMPELVELQLDLLRGFQPHLLPKLAPDQGYEAFQQHQLLSIRFLRAARTNAAGARLSGGKAWKRYFAEHFPRGDEHAVRLWDYWRCTLCKDEMPGSGVAISHGQPEPHWQIVQPGDRLYINFESMCEDYYESVNSLIEALKLDWERRNETLAWWKERKWSDQIFEWTKLMTLSASASAIPLSQIRDQQP